MFVRSSWAGRPKRRRRETRRNDRAAEGRDGPLAGPCRGRPRIPAPSRVPPGGAAAPPCTRRCPRERSCPNLAVESIVNPPLRLKPTAVAPARSNVTWSTSWLESSADSVPNIGSDTSTPVETVHVVLTAAAAGRSPHAVLGHLDARSEPNEAAIVGGRAACPAPPRRRWRWRRRHGCGRRPALR